MESLAQISLKLHTSKLCTFITNIWPLTVYFYMKLIYQGVEKEAAKLCEFVRPDRKLKSSYHALHSEQTSSLSQKN